MNTHSELDRIIGDWLDDRVVEPRQSGLDAVLDRVITTPQRRRRWLERWLPRGMSATRSAHGRGDRTDTDRSRRNRIMLTATGIVGAVGALALVSALVLPVDRARAPVGPAAGTASTYVVAPDGSGDFASVGEAVAVAVDGDTIIVKPGRYAEAIVVTKDITLLGDGPRDEIVIENQPDGPAADQEVLREFGDGTPPQFALLVEDADATIGGLTVSGPMTGGIAVIVIGGAPTLDDIAVVTQGPSGTWMYYAALYIVGPSKAHVLGSALAGFVQIGRGSSPTIEDSEVADQVSLGGAVEATLRGNAFSVNPANGFSGVVFADGSSGIFEGNDLADGALEISGGSDVEIRDSSVAGTGIRVADEGTTASITGNTVSASLRGVGVGLGGEATIEDNIITGGLAGLFLSSDAIVAEGNTITGAITGIIVDGDATPTLSGNSLCDNGTDLRVDEGNPTTLDGNEVCPPTASPAASG